MLVGGVVFYGFFINLPRVLPFMKAKVVPGFQWVQTKQ